MQLCRVADCSRDLLRAHQASRLARAQFSISCTSLPTPWETHYLSASPARTYPALPASTAEHISLPPGTHACIAHCRVTVDVSAVLPPLARDLLDLTNDNLGVTADRVRGIVLPGAAELPASGPAQMLAGLRTALANRVVGATAMNAGNARVHDALIGATLTLPVTLSLSADPDLTMLQPRLEPCVPQQTRQS